MSEGDRVRVTEALISSDEEYLGTTGVISYACGGMCRGDGSDCGFVLVTMDSDGLEVAMMKDQLEVVNE